MKDPATKRYFRFLQRLFVFFLPTFGVILLIAWALHRPFDWSRLAGIAALIAAILASISSYRTTKKEVSRKKEDAKPDQTED